MVSSLSFSRDGRFIVSGSDDETARIWDMESDDVLVLTATVRYGQYAYVRSVAISPDMKLVAGGCDDKVVRIWDANTGDLVDVLKGHTGDVNSVTFTPDGKGLVSGSWDRTVKRWDLTRFLCCSGHGRTLLVPSHAGHHPPIALPFDDPITGTAESRSTVPVDSAPTHGCGERGSVCTIDFTGHKNYVMSVAMSPDGQWVASGSADRDVRVWDSSTGEPLMLLRGHQSNGEFALVQLRALC